MGTARQSKRAARAARFVIDLPVELRVDSAPSKGTIWDISDSGARIERASVSAAVGASLELQPFLDDKSSNRWIRAAVVRSTETGGFAVRFLELDPWAQELLERLRRSRGARAVRRRLRRRLGPMAVAFETETCKGTGFLRSVSLDGFSLRAGSCPSAGEAVSVSFEGAGGSVIEVAGTVVSGGGRGSGPRDGWFSVKLDEIPDEYLAFYDRLLVG